MTAVSHAGAPDGSSGDRVGATDEDSGAIIEALTQPPKALLAKPDRQSQEPSNRHVPKSLQLRGQPTGSVSGGVGKGVGAGVGSGVGG